MNSDQIPTTNNNQTEKIVNEQSTIYLVNEKKPKEIMVNLPH